MSACSDSLPEQSSVCTPSLRPFLFVVQVMRQPIEIHVIGGVKVIGDHAISGRVSKAVNRVLEAMRPVSMEL